MRNIILTIMVLCIIAFAYTTKAYNFTLRFCEIRPLNRVTLFFDSLPQNLNSFLNEDKTMLIFTFNETKTIESKVLTGEGIIESVKFSNYSTYLELSIKLKSPRGYTYCILPTSQSIIIEVFDWKSLSPAEESYRLGLLSLPNNLNIAYNYFKNAFKEQIANAGFFLGMLYLRANQIDDALRTLTEAEKLNCNIPDINILLAQTYLIRGDTNRANEYRKRYFDLSNSTKIQFLKTNSNLKDSIFKKVSKELLFSDDFINQVNQDSTIKTQFDTIQNHLYKARIDSTKSIGTTQSPLVEKMLIYLLAVIIFLSITLFTLYLKWKKEKKNITSKKNMFNNELNKQKTNVKVGNPLLSKLYQTQINQSISKPPVIESPNPINLEVKELAKEIIASTQKKSNTENQFSEESVSSSKKIPPRLMIAMQIHQEQQELIKSKLKSIEQLPIETDTNKLIEKAKTLGLSNISILAKHNISAIERDKTLIEKLFQKFYSKDK